jgi:hypothetical protein
VAVVRVEHVAALEGFPEGVRHLLDRLADHLVAGRVHLGVRMRIDRDDASGKVEIANGAAREADGHA